MVLLVDLALLFVGCSSSQQTAVPETTAQRSTNAVSTDPQLNAILEQSCYQCHSTGGAAPWPYMAPEQTGRVNRSIDTRSDLYSLGITFYEMLTGTLPFTASDPMEWVHCHIARQPATPSDRVKSVPTAVSAITMKLLSKTVEERYQTAAGVENDLRHCLFEWETHGRVEYFALGAHDTPDRLMIPEKLYGRDGEVDTLLTAFDRIVAGGRPELVLVSGYSGIGKSAVVNELHKPLVPPRLVCIR